jgi:hypothetical protein
MQNCHLLPWASLCAGSSTGGGGGGLVEQGAGQRGSQRRAVLPCGRGRGAGGELRRGGHAAGTSEDRRGGETRKREDGARWGGREEN